VLPQTPMLGPQQLFDVKIRGTDRGCRIKETSSPD
jgi:hypothetical protein